MEAVADNIACFAVQRRVNTVLAPTHYLGDPSFENWLSVDHQACLALRLALDRAGGQSIAIDYPVILPNTMLSDPEARGRIMASLQDLPVENVWIRTSGFGSDAGPLAARRFLVSVAGFHNLGKPVVADYLGGLMGQAALAFGAVSGLSQGIAERERFDAREWHKEPQPLKEGEEANFGRTTRVTITDLSRSLTLKELEILASARSGKRLCSCSDRGCCSNGYSDMIADHRGHAARQLFRSIDAIERVPDLLREEAFLSGPMDKADRRAREIKALKPSIVEAARLGVKVDELMKRLTGHSQRMEKLKKSFENLRESRGQDGPRARPIASSFRQDPTKAQKRP